MLLAPGQQFNKYHVIDELGRGSFGTVYAAKDILMDRECALKFVQNQDPTQFKAHYEAQVLHKCRHKQIVSVNSVDILTIPGGAPYAVIDMELCSGSVITLVESNHISIKTSIKILIDVLFALEHTHKQNVLHRDIKPSNILMKGTHYKLGDFGISQNGLAGSGGGSPAYCAPEVLTDRTTNVTTDIFSLGITLFQLANSYPDLSQWIKDETPIRAGAVIDTIGYQDFVPTQIRNVCKRACAISPSKRYQSAFEMRQALERLKVAEDWHKISATEWTATIKKKPHRMVGGSAPSFENIYLINGRRNNPRCTKHPDLTSLVNAQCSWVKNNTF